MTSRCGGEAMVKSEAYYLGEGGAAYLARNYNRLRADTPARRHALRMLLPLAWQGARWLEVGCGIGSNLYLQDVGVDCDPRVLREVCRDGRLGVLGRAQKLSMFIDRSFAVVFCVGLLMHLPDGKWQQALAEMTRVSTHYVILGEYVTEVERDLTWQAEPGLLWERPYPTPVGWQQVREVRPLAPFDSDVTFLVWVRQEALDSGVCQQRDRRAGSVR